MKKVIKTVGSLLAILTLAACQETENSDLQAEMPTKITIAQMSNDVNESVPTLHKQFIEHLAEELGIEVVEVETSLYAVGIEGLSNGEIDIFQATPMTYFLAQEKLDMTIIASTSREVEYFASFIARTDNEEINSLADLRGHNFAFVNPASTSGFLYPKATLVKELDLDSDRFEQNGYFFEQIAYSGTHHTSLIGVAMGDYDAAVVSSTYVPRFEEAGLIEKGEIKVIGRSVEIPNPSYVIREDLPETFKQAVKEAFLSFDNGEYFDALYDDPNTRFVEVEQNHFDETVELLKTIDVIEGE